MKKLLTLLALAFALVVPAMAQNTAAGQKINKKNLVIKEWNTDPGAGRRCWTA